MIDGMDPKTADILSGMFAQLESDERNEAGLHYVTYRQIGGFGSRVAASLAATLVLQPYAKAAAKNPKDIPSYIAQHKKLFDYLQDKGESTMNAATASIKEGK